MSIPIGACSNRSMDHTRICTASEEDRFTLPRCSCGGDPEAWSVLRRDFKATRHQPAHEEDHLIFRLLVRWITTKLLIWEVGFFLTLFPTADPFALALAISVFFVSLWYLNRKRISLRSRAEDPSATPAGLRRHELSGPGSMSRSPPGCMPDLRAAATNDCLWGEEDGANRQFTQFQPPHTPFDRSCHDHWPFDRD